MKLEIGKTYISRNGREIVTIEEFDEQHTPHPFVGDNVRLYMHSGRWLDEDTECEHDLIREYKPMQMPPEDEMAGILYEEYCDTVGGVAYNGDKLPSWNEFKADPAKSKQVAGWIAVVKKFYVELKQRVDTRAIDDFIG